MAISIENHIGKVFAVLTALFAVFFFVFFVRYQQWIHREATVRLGEDARVISDALWRYEAPPEAYLELAARSNHYREVIILNETGSVYARVGGPDPGILDGGLARLGLLPVTRLEREVRYRGRAIGKILADWQNRSVFVCFYMLVCLGLMFAGIWFFFRLYIAGKTLKDRVRERTAALKESQDRLQAVLDNAEAVIYLKDIQGRYITINRQYETLFNLDREKIAGLTDEDIFPRNVAEIFRKNDEKILASGTSFQFEETAPGPGGGYREYVSVKFPLKRADGEIYAICGISTDITEMKLAELELHQLRNYLSNIIDSMPSVLIGVDPEGMVTLWNRRAQEVTGAKPREALGIPLDRAYPRLGTIMDRVEKALQTRTVQQHKKRPGSGEAAYEDITVFPLTGEGVEGAVIRVDDVTDQVRLEEMMVQSEKMLSVGGLAAGMAHEINNPLAGLMQTANVMSMRLEDTRIPANQKAASEVGVSLDQIRAYMEKRGIPKMLDAIHDSGARVAEIVENMLSFARKTDAIVSSHNPGALMDRILDLAATDYDLKKQYDFKAIKIVREYEPDLPMIPCEGGKIQQVILNLLRNGAEAMVTGGQDNPCFILKISVERPAGMLKIEIRDNGPGMDPEVQKRIFEPFFTTKAPGVGTGLGLSVSYFIITENHGGTMGVSSAPGKGSNFIIRLPLEARQSSGHQSRREAEHHAG